MNINKGISYEFSLYPNMGESIIGCKSIAACNLRANICLINMLKKKCYKTGLIDGL